jgi:hypothetical protein
MAIPVATASGEIRRGKLYLTDRAAFDENLRTLKDGTSIELEVYQLRATRSHSQNKGYWGVIIEALSQHTGYAPEELHELMKAKFLPKTFGFAKANGDIVGEYVIGGSTRKLDTKEFGEYMERIKEWAASELDVYIPDFNDRGYGVGV